MPKPLIFAVLIFATEMINQILSNNDSTSSIRVIALFDICVLGIYISYIGRFKAYLYPSSIFVYSFFAYAILGKYVWIYREIYWFNEFGDPLKIALYFSFIGVVLATISALNITKFGSKKEIKLKQINMDLGVFVGLTAICFIGAFFFTNKFQNIPLLSENMDAGRVAVGVESEGGRGIGFALLLFGIVANSIALFQIRLLDNTNKIIYIFLIAVNTTLLALYSGRFLPLMPFLIFALFKYVGVEVSFMKIASGLVLAILGFTAIMYFGAIRAFGEYADTELVTRYIIGDVFPEFRMTIYGHYLTETNLVTNFLLTIFAGLVPGVIFNVFDINKFDFFQPIGIEILNFTHFDPAAIPGIRTSLFGELSFTGWFIGPFLTIVYIILRHLDKGYLNYYCNNFKRYRIMVISMFFALSIPYGSLFLISVIQISIILLLLERYVFLKK